MKKVVKEYIEKNKKDKTKKLSKQVEASDLIAKYIQLYEQDKIEGTKYRNLCYGVKIYSEILRNHWLDEAEKRLVELEQRYNNEENEELTFTGWSDEELDDYILKGTEEIKRKKKNG